MTKIALVPPPPQVVQLVQVNRAYATLGVQSCSLSAIVCRHTLRLLLTTYYFCYYYYYYYYCYYHYYHHHGDYYNCYRYKTSVSFGLPSRRRLEAAKCVAKFLQTKAVSARCRGSLDFRKGSARWHGLEP